MWEMYMCYMKQFFNNITENNMCFILFWNRRALNIILIIYFVIIILFIL